VRYPVEAEVREILKPYDRPLIQIHQRAWDRLVACNEWPTLLFSRTGSVMMHDLVIQEAAKVIDDIDGVRRIGRDKTIWYMFSDRVVVRFKKGRRGLGSNIDTAANDQFILQEADLLDMSDLMKVELLWYANTFKTKLDRLVVSARDDQTVLWNYVMGDEPVVTLFRTSLPTPEKTKPDLVALRPVKKADVEGDE